MELIRPLSGVAARLSMTSRAHHRDSKRRQSITQRGRFSRAQDDADLWKGQTEGANQLGEVAIVEGKFRLEGSSRGTESRQAHRDLGSPADTLQMEQMPWHLAYKDAHIHSSLKKMWKFEYFIFDLLPLSNSVSIIKGCREDCYAPLKNAAGEKSIGTVQNALFKKYQKIYSDLSGLKAPERVFELDQMFWYPTDEMRTYWKGKTLPEKEIIEPMSL